MSPVPQSRSVGTDPAGQFATTHWSVVLAAAGEDAREALETLCQIYWSPLYVYVRRQGHSPHDAQDLTQQFFLKILKAESIKLANQSRGRFRTFLLAALRNFLVDEWKAARAAK